MSSSHRNFVIPTENVVILTLSEVEWGRIPVFRRCKLRETTTYGSSIQSHSRLDVAGEPSFLDTYRKDQLPCYEYFAALKTKISDL
jgi:hypothetical protein